jgi:hypothetical protein
VVDLMLGSLARWLRILGFDTQFGPDFDDDALIRTSNATGRLLLTADRGLVARPAARRSVQLPPSGLDRQWTSLNHALSLGQWIRPFTRCQVCNVELKPLTRDRARERVPPHVFDSSRSFAECPACRRMFWPGTHRDLILNRLGLLRALPESHADWDRPHDEAAIPRDASRTI